MVLNHVQICVENTAGCKQQCHSRTHFFDRKKKKNSIEKNSKKVNKDTYHNVNNIYIWIRQI